MAAAKLEKCHKVWLDPDTPFRFVDNMEVVAGKR
jgi:hypothetical protein